MKSRDSTPRICQEKPEAGVVYVFEEYVLEEELEGTVTLALRNCRRFVGKHRPTTRQFNWIHTRVARALTPSRKVTTATIHNSTDQIF